jgi:arylformamidase
VALAPEAADWIVAHGIRPVGIDALSIEAFDGDGATHHRLLGAGVVIVEGLSLDEIPPGEYDLICLPMKIAGGDGAPARVVLVAPDARG